MGSAIVYLEGFDQHALNVQVPPKCAGTTKMHDELRRSPAISNSRGTGQKVRVANIRNSKFRESGTPPGRSSR